MAAWRLCAAALVGALAAPASAQPASPAVPGDLDPSAPLDPMPDLGLEWPDLDANDEPPPPAPQPVAEEPAAELPAAVSDGNAAAEIRYTVAIQGLETVGSATELTSEFDQQSVLHNNLDDPANAAQIDRRSRADAELLAELLRSHGYYDALVEPRIERAAGALLVVLEAEPGSQYRFQSVELPGLDAAGAEAAKLREAFAVKSGDPVIAQEVIAANVALTVALGEQGFALAKVGEQEIVIDHETRTARLVLPVDTGPLASFGSIRVSGRPPFSAGHVARIARFETGEPFRQSQVDDLRRALIATGLVASAEVKVVPAADGRTVDLAVNLDPAPMRTVAGELGYGTGEGIRAEASWQHRNFFNPEGALTVRGVAGTQEQLAAVQLRRSNFMRRDQVLNLHALASHIDRDAYKAKTLLVGGNLERQSNIIWHKKWTWSVGADLLATDERGVFNDLGVKDTRTFLIAAFPAHLGYDGSDDLLDPTRGFRLGGRLSPEISAHGGSFAYGRAQLDASVYRPLSSSVVAAGRIRLAKIVGSDAMSIAPSRRLYAGGGGSVRGYGYQKLGPRDLDGDPIGGGSLAEFALEARIRLNAFGGNFGIVPFLDGGTLTNDEWPRLSDWQFGAGLGLRYYSSFGPIRIDVGTPLNPRAGDSRVAVTVSLGQAF
ncbi:MAG TPA: BamA/TamA family outer membrane protein [Sphingomicrobium sp.]|nr:BamA/TamA family outer membrane protein [Sphingomicrobium sp.]